MDKNGEIPRSCLAPGGAWKAEIWHKSDETAVLSLRPSRQFSLYPVMSSKRIAFSVSHARYFLTPPRYTQNRGRVPQINHNSSIEHILSCLTFKQISF